MVNERYDEENQEEGEYHFSDDQTNYDMEMDAAKDSTAAAVAPKESVTEKLKQHRRIVIGIIVFIVLLGIVYKLVAPSSAPSTEFQPATPAALPAKAPVKQTPTPPPIAAQAPAVSPPAVQQTVTTTQPAASSPPIPAPVMSQPAVPAPTVAEPAVTPSAPVTTTPVTTGAPLQNDKPISDRVATLEQESNAMMNLMQTQYAQKIADTELQNTQLRTEVQELSTRISNMEVAFRQLTKMLRSGGGAPTVRKSEVAAVISPPPARSIQPRISYTVQAIIPGRAWLKSDSGDTVTVAEGDMLRGYGRITKIDPYDGVVDIDTGSRVISLSYGVSGD
ncbi:MAG TPA: hypothetical protein VLI69_05795 [Gammaproteobacteria bacterium]|nr:hypothetical protein [Gammaproteobacteria bacterium]